MYPDPTSGWRRFLLVLLMLLTASAAATGARTARAETAPATHVLSFVAAVEAAMALNRARRMVDLQLAIARHFSVADLARTVAPQAFWDVADTDQRRRFASLLVCRIAAETSRRGAAERPSDWRVVGERAEAAGPVVALRVAQEDGGARTLVFELKAAASGPLIRDIRSESGRLSVRMAETLEVAAGPMQAGNDPAAWLSRVTCR